MQSEVVIFLLQAETMFERAKRLQVAFFDRLLAWLVIPVQARKSGTTSHEYAQTLHNMALMYRNTEVFSILLLMRTPFQKPECASY